MLVLFWSALSAFNIDPIIKRIFIHKTKVVYVKQSAREFTQEKFVSYLKRIRIKYPEIVFAQALRETSFNSKPFRTKCNLFGMTVASERIGIGKGNLNGLAEYNTWEESVIDYAFWQYSKQKLFTDKESYFRMLESYAEDPDYVQKVKQSANQYKYLFK